MFKKPGKSESKLDIKSTTAFLYLQQIQTYYNTCNHPLFLLSDNDLKSPYKELEKVLNKIKTDLEQKNPERLYQKFHEAMELVAQYENKKNNINSPQSKTLDPLFLLVYENNSNIEQVIYEHVIQNNNNLSTKESIAKNLKENTTNPDKEFDVTHPDNRANAFFSSMIGIDYHPLKNNNIPYVAFQEKEKNRTCLRMGAQTQKSKKINPTFKRYLLANARKNNSQEDKPYQYVYINLLKKTADEQDKAAHKKTLVEKRVNQFVRSSEDKRGSAIELLNYNKNLKTAVITLPADGDFLLGQFSMRKGTAKDTETISYEALLKSIKDSINENKNDFYIPNKIREQLFGNDMDNGQLELLFKQAVTDVIGNHNNASAKYFDPAQRNAILVQFIKFHLSNHILDTLNPRAYNFSCKDGIDRGAIHTLWYHMNLMHAKGTPMTQQAFLTHLDSPALIVKYRPLNENKNLIWNTLKARMMADIDFATKHQWANEWLKNNAPTPQVHCPTFEMHKQSGNLSQGGLPAHRASTAKPLPKIPIPNKKHP